MATATQQGRALGGIAKFLPKTVHSPIFLHAKLIGLHVLEKPQNAAPHLFLDILRNREHMH